MLLTMTINNAPLIIIIEKMQTIKGEKYGKIKEH